MGRVLSTLVVLNFCLLVNSKAFADTPVDEGMLFFEAFASKCASNGPFSSRALEDTRTLESIVRTVKDDPACKGLDGLVNAIVTASEQLSFVRQGTEEEQKKNLQDLQRRLTVAYAISIDPAEQASIQQRLAEVQFQLLELPGIQTESRWMQRENAVRNLSNYLQQASEQYATQLNCFENHKTLPAQLGLQLLALSGGFFDPKINLAVTLAGRMLNSFFNFFSNWKLNKRIEDYRKTTMQAGLSCAMEALEQTVCDLQDQAKLVETLTRVREDDTVAEAWAGYDLYQRDYPIVQKFLRQVEVGSDPTSKDQSDRRRTFNDKETAFKNTRDQVLGLLGDAEEDLRLADLDSDDVRRQSKRGTIIQNLISSMVGTIYGSGEPYSGTIPGQDRYSALQIWLRIGTPSPTLPAGKNYLSEFLQYLDSPESSYRSVDAQIKQDLSQIRDVFNLITSFADDRLGLERYRTINPDKEGALFNWTTSSATGQSPGVVMLKLSEYLKSVEESWKKNPTWFASAAEQETQVNLVVSTRQRFDETLSILNNPMTPAEKLNRIYVIMQLRDHDTIMNTRIHDIVEQDLLKRLREGFLRNDPAILDTAARISTKSMLESLTPHTPEARTAVLTHIQDDILRANSYAQANIMHFYKHYGETVAYVLNYLKDLAFNYAPRSQKKNGKENFKMPEQTSEGSEYSRICILALNDPNLDDGEHDEILKLCEGRELSFRRQSGEVAIDPYQNPLIVKFDEMMNRDPLDRLCVYRRYSNRRDLYELLRQRPSAYFDNFKRPIH